MWLLIILLLLVILVSDYGKLIISVIYIVLICFKLILFIFASGKLPPVQIPDDWITIVDPCTRKMKEQVQEELTAAMTYFAMVKIITWY